MRHRASVSFVGSQSYGSGDGIEPALDLDESGGLDRGLRGHHRVQDVQAECGVGAVGAPGADRARHVHGPRCSGRARRRWPRRTPMPPRLMRISPPKVFGSGATRVDSAPVISRTPIRSRGVSKLNVAWATAPDSNSHSRDVGGNRHGDRFAGPWPFADDPGWCRSAAARGHAGDGAERLGERGQVVVVVIPDSQPVGLGGVRGPHQFVRDRFHTRLGVLPVGRAVGVDHGPRPDRRRRLEDTVESARAPTRA